MESNDLNDNIDELYDDVNEYDQEDFDDQELFEDDGFVDDEDPAELERRRTKYAELKRGDKIFNNTYNMGYETSEEDDEESIATVREIKVDASSPDFFMYDKEQYSEYVDQGIIQKEIFSYIEKSEEINAILGPEPERKKFVKSEINDLFKMLCTGLIHENNKNYFITPIYILDAISVTLSTDYKKLFDMLTYENKEVLLLELNSKYGFLDKLNKSNKMF